MYTTFKRMRKNPNFKNRAWAPSCKKINGKVCLMTPHNKGILTLNIMTFLFLKSAV